MVYLEKPEGFQAQLIVAGNFITCGDEILLLLRQDHKPQGGTWGVPGGKVDPNEPPEHAALRELVEETGLKPAQPLLQLQTTYVCDTGFSFVYYMFALELAEKPLVTIDLTSHKEYMWYKTADVYKLPFIPGLDEHIALFLAQKN